MKKLLLVLKITKVVFAFDRRYSFCTDNPELIPLNSISGQTDSGRATPQGICPSEHTQSDQC